MPEPRTGLKAVSKKNYKGMLAAGSLTRDRAILTALCSSGCRRGGMISMNIDQLESWHQRNRPCFAILVTEKGNKFRHVYVKGKAGVYLPAYLQERPSVANLALLLSHHDHRLSVPGFSGIMAQLRRDAGIPAHEPASAHAFRHAFAIRKLDEGYDLALVSQWLGHSNPEFTAKVHCVRSEQQLRQRFFQKPG